MISHAVAPRFSLPPASRVGDVGKARLMLAQIGAAHGVKGEVRVKPFTADPQSLGTYGPLDSDSGRMFEIERLRPAGNMLIAKFRGIDDRNAAETLNGVSLFIDRDRLPTPDADEFYHADLIGLTAVTEAGKPLGSVTAVHNFGAGDILEISSSRGPALLVPFTKAVVPSDDVAGGRLIVIPPSETEDADNVGAEERGT